MDLCGDFDGLSTIPYKDPPLPDELFTNKEKN